MRSTATETIGRTTLIHLDHMNDYKGYTKLLAKWAKQLKLGGVLFLSLNCQPRPRHIFCLLDSPQVLGGTGEFLTRLRTRNVDVNSRGVPCKERMSTIVAEFPLLLSDNKNDHKQQQQELGVMPPMGDFRIVQAEGSNGAQTHMPFVRDWLHREYRPEDAEVIIAAMDTFLDSTTTKSKKR